VFGLYPSWTWGGGGERATTGVRQVIHDDGSGGKVTRHEERERETHTHTHTQL